MKALILAIALAAVPVTHAGAAPWNSSRLAADLQAQKPPQGGGQNGGQRGREGGSDRRADRGEKREQLSDEERKGLHRDLDKANRELYQRRGR